MAYNTDWLSRQREGQLSTAKNWISVFSEAAEGTGGAEQKKYEAWGIPKSVLTDLGARYSEAAGALSLAQNAETRTNVVNQKCRTAFTDLVSCLRGIKDRYFKKPPLSDADFISLDLRVKDSSPGVIRPPEGQAEVVVSYPGPHLLAVHIRLLAGTTVDPKAEHGYCIYWGIMPHGGATVEEAVSERRYLMKPPVSGAELPHNKFTRRKKETFDFPPEDSGKTVYFCVRLENSKGDKGPWGPIVSVIIP